MSIAFGMTIHIVGGEVLQRELPTLVTLARSADCMERTALSRLQYAGRPKALPAGLEEADANFAPLILVHRWNVVRAWTDAGVDATTPGLDSDHPNDGKRRRGCEFEWVCFGLEHVCQTVWVLVVSSIHLCACSPLVRKRSVG